MSGPRRPAARRKSYHHPDLRRALLDAALAHLRDGDVATLTMLDLARRAGVSPGAPYHHFDDKVSLLAALASEGWSLFFARALEARSHSAAPRRQLAALARAWLEFTAAHPAHYRVMLVREVEDRTRFPELHATSGRSLSLLVEVVGAGRGTRAEIASRAVSLWSALHGFASLRAAGVLQNIPGLPPISSLEAAAVQHAVELGLPGAPRRRSS